MGYSVCKQGQSCCTTCVQITFIPKKFVIDSCLFETLCFRWDNTNSKFMYSVHYAVHIKEWFNSFITSMYCSTTRHWFSSYLSLSSYCILLLPPTQSSHSALMLEMPQVARQGHCLLIHKNLSWLPQGLAKSYPYGRHHLLQYWSPIQLLHLVVLTAALTKTIHNCQCMTCHQADSF